MVKSNILPYKFAYLSMVKYIWPYSKNIEHIQKKLNATKIFFELADGLGIGETPKVHTDVSDTKLGIFLSFT